MSTIINLDKLDREPESFNRGDVIFKEGERGTYMYLVKEGEVEILRNDRLIDTVGTGGIIGEMALIDMSPRSATARAKSDCRLIPVDEYYFIFLVQHAPYFSLQVMRVLAERLRALMDK